MVSRTATRQDIDLCVVGGGPFGLACGSDPDFRDLSVAILEGRSPGGSWGPQFMGGNWEMYSGGKDICRDSSLNFSAFQRINPELHSEESDSKVLTAQYSEYLSWLAAQNQIESGCVNRLGLVDGRPAVYYTTKRGRQERIVAGAVVCATGMVGDGKNEFIFDPSGLRGRTPYVRHCPGDIRSDQIRSRCSRIHW